MKKILTVGFFLIFVSVIWATQNYSYRKNPPPPNSVNLYDINQPIGYYRSIFYLPTEQVTYVPQQGGGYPAIIASGNYGFNVPTSTGVVTSTSTMTRTATTARTSTPSFTSTSTYTSTPTFTYTLTYTSTKTYTPTGSYTPTYTPTSTFNIWTHTPGAGTNTWTPTSTFTPTGSSTPTYTYTPSYTPTYTRSNTPTYTLTFTYSPTTTFSPTPTQYPKNYWGLVDTSFEAVSVINRVGTTVNILRNTGKYARVHPAWSHPMLFFPPPSTVTCVPTSTPLNTNTPNYIWTVVAYSPTATNTTTKTATNTATNTATSTKTNTATNTATNTVTQTPTNTATATQTCNPAVTPKCYNQIMGMNDTAPKPEERFAENKNVEKSQNTQPGFWDTVLAYFKRD